jgi:murein DD-endopeptidase MepM/ murein hydrolase activator NlpD
LILVLILVGSGIAYLFLRDHAAPSLTLTPASGPVSLKRTPVLRIEDDGAGLKDLLVNVSQEGKVTELLRTTFERGTSKREIPLPLNKLKLKNGPFSVNVQAGDHAVLGNAVEQSFALEFDTRPPVVSVLTTAHNFNQGGAGLVLYRVSEDTERNGVQLGERFFPGFLQEEGFYACLIPFPYDMTRSDFVPRILAVDKAGNERTAGFYYHTNARPARQDRINLSDRFLANKMPDFQHLFPETTDPAQLFLKVNRELRARNRAKLKELAEQSADRPLWQGAFLRLPNAAMRADFADRRHYYLNGRRIDRQTHLGIDLASVANAPVPAANSGTVIFADDYGIYGQCIILDHGLGLQTLYAHLSSMDVAVGDQVKKGQNLGRTGTTGMAGGDHLHYGVILAGQPINPREWWDATWLKHNFLDKWAHASGQQSN